MPTYLHQELTAGKAGRVQLVQGLGRAWAEQEGDVFGMGRVEGGLVCKQAGPGKGVETGFSTYVVS